jgi:catechol 2,3-dioxygenase-like lactoylglutathione lyase family enzyme
MMEQRISVITLAVDDLEETRRFFEDGLGWSPAAGGGPEVRFYQAGGNVLAIYARAALEKEIGRKLPSQTLGGITIAWNGRSEAEVDAVFSKVVEAGALPVKQPEKAFWGGYSSYVEIPGGHLMEIAHNPFWPIAADGRVTIPKGTKNAD